MYEAPFTLSNTERTLMLVCISLLAATGLYAWLVSEIFNTFSLILISREQTYDLRVFPLLFLIALTGGFACGALVSITLRRNGFMRDTKSTTGPTL
ncbi:hypothetical protein [Erwinia mallotivora]|uniref:hypothetical protein n=1 Tax=Erwinia mallotivora TaxID=69222 RepID=UPI0021C18C63|nr:hypothetical protein [Erwinia mallotivora]